MKTLQDSLARIETELDEKWSKEDEDGGFFSNELWDHDPRLIRDFLRTSLQQVVREALESVVPEEVEMSEPNLLDCEVIAFNSCRSEIQRRVREFIGEV